MIKQLRGILSDKEKRLKIIVALGIAGIVLIVVSDFMPKSKTNAEQNSSMTDTLDETEKYRMTLEQQLKDIISEIDGAGETKVMISVAAAKEYVYAEKSDIDRRSQSEGESIKTRGEPVISGQEPLLRTILVPKVKGAVIVCEGADDPVTCERVLNAAAAVLGLPFTKISVQPLRIGNESISTQ